MMKKGKLFCNLKLLCLMTPVCGFTLAPLPNIGEVVIDTQETEDNTVTNNIRDLSISNIINTYLQEEVKIQKDEKENMNFKSTMQEMIEEATEKEEKKQEIIIKEQQKETEKEKVLNTFKKCKSLEDIQKRRKELESLNLTEDDKIYKDCKASAEMQHFIYEQSIINNYPFDFMLSIVSTETRDEFNSHGNESYNKSCNNYDLGYTQQNSEWSLPNFQKKFNLKYEDAYNLLQYDDYANVYAAFLEFEEINRCHKEFDPYEYAGCYNGWTNWRQKETARAYVYKYFTSAYDKQYNKHHKIEKEKKLKK